jgi:hypothetical protein
LDECLPRILNDELSEHEVRTTHEMQWHGIKNGKLLALAAHEFDAFVTVDKSLRYQQNVVNVDIAIVTLGPKTNRFEDILPLVPRLREVLPRLRPRTVTEIF